MRNPQTRRIFLARWLDSCLGLSQRHSTLTKIEFVDTSYTEEFPSAFNYSQFFKIIFFQKDIANQKINYTHTTQCPALNELRHELQNCWFDIDPKNKVFTANQVSHFHQHFLHSKDEYERVDNGVASEHHIVLAIHKSVIINILRYVYNAQQRSSKPTYTTSRYFIEPNHLIGLNNHTLYRLSTDFSFLQQFHDEWRRKQQHQYNEEKHQQHRWTLS